MNYRYTLSAYDETGAEKELNFETSRILTDDAYLCLKVAPFRGVVTWAEVQFDEMPGRRAGTIRQAIRKREPI